MENYSEIIKWTNYFSRWCIRYYKIDGAMFCYSTEKNSRPKNTAFLGICKMQSKNNYLEMSTGSNIWYFKGQTPSETECFKNRIWTGIEKGKEILDSNHQNLEFIAESSQIKEINEKEEFYFNINSGETLDSILDKQSSSTIIDNNNYSQALKKLESKIKILNNAFKIYLNSDEYDKEDLKELYNQYQNIEKKLNKINNFLNNQ